MTWNYTFYTGTPLVRNIDTVHLSCSICLREFIFRSLQKQKNKKNLPFDLQCCKWTTSGLIGKSSSKVIKHRLQLPSQPGSRAGGHDMTPASQPIRKLWGGYARRRLSCLPDISSRKNFFGFLTDYWVMTCPLNSWMRPHKSGNKGSIRAFGRLQVCSVLAPMLILILSVHFGKVLRE